jgi:hypothetical protein
MKSFSFFNSSKINFTKLFLELLVVFLGVTGGFLLQNYKEIRADRDLEKKYLEGIHTDTKENITELKESIAEDSLWLEQNRYALALIVKDSLPYDSAKTLMIHMAFFSEFNAQTNTYANIANSGNLNIIEDYELRQLIVDCFNNFENFKLLEIYFQKHNGNNFMPYLIANYNMFTRELISDDSHKKNEFINIFAIHYSLTQQRLDAYRNLLEENMDLEKLLLHSISKF